MSTGNTCSATPRDEPALAAGTGGEIPPLLAGVFQELTQAGVDYCLLRGYAELTMPADRREVDLLVAPHAMRTLVRVLTRHGFTSLPAWGHAPHRFFLARDNGRNEWVKFDAVSQLCFGHPQRTLCIDFVADCLKQRRRQGPTFVLAPQHGLLTLLLHAILDKGQIRPERAAELVALQREVVSDPEAQQNLAQHVGRFLEPVLTVAALNHAVAQQDWHALLRLRRPLARQLFRHQRGAAMLRQWTGSWLRRLRPLLFAICRRGISVVLLAPDGAGKSTLAQALQKQLGLPTRLIYMGSNIAASNVALPTTRWLHRLRRNRASHGNRRDWITTVLRPLNYGNRLLEQWYRLAIAHYERLRGRIVIFDRFVYDSWVAKPVGTLGKKLRRALLELGWPRPALVLLLDAPGELLHARKGEHTPAWLEQQRQAYLALRERIPQMRVVDATRPLEEVHREAVALVWGTYQKRTVS